jgi:hypothetical protein
MIERGGGLFTFTYQLQTHFRKTGWPQPGPDCGLYPDRPASSVMIGDLPSGCISRSSAGGIFVWGSRE